MAVGRNQTDHTDVGYKADTFRVDGVTLFYDRTKSLGIGKAAGTGSAVMLSDNDTVALTNDGAQVKGKILKIESDNFAAVQVLEYITLPKGDSGTNSVTRGRKIVGATRAGARGYVRDVDPATAAELAVAKGEVIDVSDNDNVVIQF